nr:4-oxalocrotonate tautomerase family protein [Pseudomonas koreensis]
MPPPHADEARTGDSPVPFISVRITRDGVTKEQKAQVIAEITKTMQTVLNKDPHLTHIVVEEVDTDNWGYAGITTTEYRQSLVEPK